MRAQYAVYFTKIAEREFEALIRKNRRLGERISRAIARLGSDSTCGQSLSGSWKGYFKYRVGDYRIIYRINHGRLVIFIIAIAHRKEVYRVKKV